MMTTPSKAISDAVEGRAPQPKCMTSSTPGPSNPVTSGARTGKRVAWWGKPEELVVSVTIVMVIILLFIDSSRNLFTWIMSSHSPQIESATSPLKPVIDAIKLCAVVGVAGIMELQNVRRALQATLKSQLGEEHDD